MAKNKWRNKRLLATLIVLITITVAAITVYRHQSPVGNKEKKAPTGLVVLFNKMDQKSMGEDRLRYFLSITDLTYVIPFATNNLINATNIHLNFTTDELFKEMSFKYPSIYFKGPLAGSKETKIMVNTERNKIVIQGKTYEEIYYASHRVILALVKKLNPVVKFDEKSNQYILYFQHPVSGKWLPISWGEKTMEEIVSIVPILDERGNHIGEEEIRRIILGET